MKINGLSNNTSFGRLKININKKLLKSAPIKQELIQLKKIFKENGFSRKKNVNVYLDYDKNQSTFVGIIESKKQGIPNNPDYRHIISPNKKDVNSFGEWLDTWDYMYSPKGIKEWNDFKKQACDEVKKHFHIVSIRRT